MFCKVIDMKGSWLFSWRGEGIEPIQPKLGAKVLLSIIASFTSL